MCIRCILEALPENGNTDVFSDLRLSIRERRFIAYSAYYAERKRLFSIEQRSARLTEQTKSVTKIRYARLCCSEE